LKTGPVQRGVDRHANNGRVRPQLSGNSTHATDTAAIHCGLFLTIRADSRLYASESGYGVEHEIGFGLRRNFALHAPLSLENNVEDPGFPEGGRIERMDDGAGQSSSPADHHNPNLGLHSEWTDYNDEAEGRSL